MVVLSGPLEQSNYRSVNIIAVVGSESRSGLYGKSALVEMQNNESLRYLNSGNRTTGEARE